jgi:hypothetical protein
MGPKGAKKRTHKQKRRRHSRKQAGGGWGFTGASSIPGPPGIVSNPQVFTAIGDCRAVEPGYTIPVSAYGASLKGLPGMSGGKRRTTKKARKGRKTRKQRGGRYGFFPQGDPNPSGQAWWAGSYAPIQRIACEGTTHNPLNPTHTGSSAPPGAADPNYWMKGGGQAMAPATYGVGNVDSMYYYGPTAGYANTASTWRDSVGAPVQIQVPFAARSMNQACLSTGGHPPLTGALQKGGKRNRKNRTRRGGGLLTTFKEKAAGLFGMGAAAVAESEEVDDIIGANEAANEAANENNLNEENTENVHELTNNNVPMNGEVEAMAEQEGGRKRKHRRRHGTKKRTHKRKH